MTVILSVFPGVDLLGMAFEEEWPGACVVRGPDVLWGGDVRRFHPPAGRFDGLIGGPPCQAFSTLSNLVRAKGYEPRFGNLIPEFTRVVEESRPAWFLMENVTRAPAPAPAGYAVHTFTMCNAALGEEQERLRRFWFGVPGPGADWLHPDRRASRARDLRRWIQLAPLMLPGRAGAVTQTHVDNSAEAKGRVPTVTSTEGGGRNIRQRVRQGSAGNIYKPSADWATGARKPAVTGAHGGHKRPKGGHLVVYQWAEMLRLQGLPPDFLEDAPFTAQGKRGAVANGVPLPMGRAIARAVRAAIEAREAAS